MILGIDIAILHPTRDPRNVRLLPPWGQVIPVAPDSLVTAIVRGTESKNEIEIKCFQEYPPPPDLRSCAACGTFGQANAQPFSFKAEHGAFAGALGSMHLSAFDATGDRAEVKLLISDSC